MNLNVIRSLTIRSAVEGADKTKADLKGIQSAHEGVARVTDTSAKGQLSLADAVSKAERRFNTSIRSQQDFEKVQRQMNLAVAQNPALQARANAVLALASTHFDQVSKGQRAFATATQAANDNLRGFAQSAGPVGSLLAAMGPAGIIAAGGIGAAVIALHQMITAATNLADRAGKLKDFAETTGFTVIELQALEKAGAQVGVSSESVTKALERFSVQMAEVKLATGETYDKLLAINPVLARQVAEATSLSKAYELVSRAIKGADLESGNQLARAFFGRGGVEQTRLMRAVAEVGGLKGVTAELSKVDAITAAQAERWDTLGDKIAENMKAAKQNIASIFTEPVLEAAERFSKAFLELSREMKQFEVSERLKTVMEFFSNPITQGAMAGALAGARGGLAGAAVGAIAGGGAAALFSHADTAQTTEDVAKLRFELEQLERSKTIAAQRVVDAVNPADVQKYAAILERTNQRIAEIQRQMPRALPEIVVNANRPAGPDGADRAAERAATADRAYREGLIKTYNEMQRWMGAIAGALTLTEKYERETARLNAQWAQGRINSEQLTRGLEDQKEKLELSLGVANMAVITEERLRQVREVSAKAGLTDEQTRLALTIAAAEARERENQAWVRANPIMAKLKDQTEDFTKTLVDGLLSGANMMDTLHKAVDRLISSLASGAIQSLFRGDLVGAAIQAAVAGVLALGKALRDLPDWAKIAVGVVSPLTLLASMGPSEEQKALEEAKKKFGGMAEEVRNFNAAAAGFGLSSLVTAIQAIAKTGRELFLAAAAAGDFAAAIQIAHNALRQVNNTVDEFIKPRGNTVADQVAAVNNEAQQIIAELNALNQQYNVGLNRTTEILAAAADHIAEIQRKAQEAINTRRQSIQDEIFGETNDNSSLAGQIAALERELLRRREAEIKEGGEALADIDQLYLVKRNNLVADFNDRAIEETKRAEQEKLDAITRATRGIVDYINNLKSALSPTARLAAAQGTYNSILSLAQGGNVDALSRITQDFENFRKAAQAVYGSAGPYQNILNAGIAQLQGLPAVATSTDPVVQAVLGTTAAVEATRQAVLTDTVATVAKLDVAIARLVDAVSLFSQAVNHLVTSNALLTTSNAVLTAIQGLQSTANTQLELLKNQLTATATLTLTVTKGGAVFNLDVAATSTIDALRKIVANTYATSVNTAILASNGQGANSPNIIGVAATGGWINGPGGPHDDRAGLYALSNREYVVNADATRALTSQFGNGIMDTINAGRLPERTNVIPFPTPSRSYGGNDNSRIEAILQRIEARLLSLEKTVGNTSSAQSAEQRDEHRREIAELRAQTRALERGQRDSTTRQNIARKTGTG